jgi:hypothetical protein
VSRAGLIAAAVVLLGTARCPVGCRQRPPVTNPFKIVTIPIQPINACQYRVVGELPQVEGFPACHIDDESAIPHQMWELDGGILTIVDQRYCSTDAGTHPVELVFYQWDPVEGADYPYPYK